MLAEPAGQGGGHPGGELAGGDAGPRRLPGEARDRRQRLAAGRVRGTPSRRPPGKIERGAGWQGGRQRALGRGDEARPQLRLRAVEPLQAGDVHVRHRSPLTQRRRRRRLHDGAKGVERLHHRLEGLRHGRQGFLVARQVRRLRTARLRLLEGHTGADPQRLERRRALQQLLPARPRAVEGHARRHRGRSAAGGAARGGVCHPERVVPASDQQADARQPDAADAPSATYSLEGIRIACIALRSLGGCWSACIALRS